MKQKILEKEVVKAVKDAFPEGNNDGVWITRYQVGRPSVIGKGGKEIRLPMGVAGMPDFIGIVDHRCCPSCGRETMNGTFVGIECKADGGKQSSLQIEMQKKINGMNGVCFVISPDKFGTLRMRERILGMINSYSYCEKCRNRKK